MSQKTQFSRARRRRRLQQAEYLGEFRLLQGGLVLLGTVATATGASVIAVGTRAIPGATPMSASAESVLRFYAAWWLSTGPTLWLAAARGRKDRTTLSRFCATTFVGGIGRVLAMRQSGMPHPMFRALTAIELAGSPLLYLWHRRLTSAPDELAQRAD